MDTQLRGSVAPNIPSNQPLASTIANNPNSRLSISNPGALGNEVSSRSAEIASRVSMLPFNRGGATNPPSSSQYQHPGIQVRYQSDEEILSSVLTPEEVENIGDMLSIA